MKTLKALTLAFGMIAFAAAPSFATASFTSPDGITQNKPESKKEKAKKGEKSEGKACCSHGAAAGTKSSCTEGKNTATATPATSETVKEEVKK